MLLQCADRQIQDNDMMLMDMGCEYYGYDRRAAYSYLARTCCSTCCACWCSGSLLCGAAPFWKC